MANEQEETQKKCGYVAIIGAPNAGKSTLLNQLVGQKLSIISHKVQTTRFPVKGIINKNNAQMILIDTPGIFSPKKRLDKAMVAAAWDGAKDADIIIHLIDAPSINRAIKDIHQKGDKLNFEDYERVSTGLKNSSKPAILALNKIDEIDKTELLELAKRTFEDGKYEQLVMISALKNKGLNELVNFMSNHIPVGEWLYPEDQVSDIPLRLMASEITREKVFLRLHDELPYTTTVETDNWQDRKDGSVRIDQTIYVARDSHKGITIGKNGETLKWISRQSREEISREIERVVHLFVHVKVKENWGDDRNHYNSIGLNYDAG